MLIYKPQDQDYNAELDNLGTGKSPIIDMREVSLGVCLNTYEEVEAYLRSCKREFTELVVYHTGTPNRLNMDLIGLRKYYTNVLERGIVNYHLLILRNGQVQIGRRISEETLHTPVSNHIPRSVSVAFVGGLNNNGIEDSKGFTGSQWKSYSAVLRAFYSIMPGGQVLGHNSINTATTNPGFNVEDFSYSRFGKRNVIDNETFRSLGSLDKLQIITFGSAY